MADDMSQGSENSDYEDDGMCEDDDYYDDPDDFMETETDKKKDDPEYFEFELLKVEDVDRLLNESVEALCKSMQVGLVAVLKWASYVFFPFTINTWCFCPKGQAKERHGSVQIHLSIQANNPNLTCLDENQLANKYQYFR